MWNQALKGMASEPCRLSGRRTAHCPGRVQRALLLRKDVWPDTAESPEGHTGRKTRRQEGGTSLDVEEDEGTGTERLSK